MFLRRAAYLKKPPRAELLPPSHQVTTSHTFTLALCSDLLPEVEGNFLTDKLLLSPPSPQLIQPTHS